MAGVSRPSIRIGKLTSKKALFPTEPGYIESMKASTRELEDILLGLLKSIEEQSVPVMVNALQPTFEKSQLYCPVDTGALLASGYLEATSYRQNPRVEIGYARGGQPSYAVVVHENLSFYHKAPTRAKWLQAAMLEDLPAIFTRLGQEYKAATGLT